MGIIYDKTETEDKVVFRFSRLPWLFLFAISVFPALFILSLLPPGTSTGVWVFVIGALLFVFIGSLEKKFAMAQVAIAHRENGNCSRSGSKYSFSNPLTLEIIKKKPSSPP